MAKLPTFSSADFDWKSGTATSTVGRLGVINFPRAGFYIRSARTAEVRLFLPDGETMEANEFFDGEAAAYFVPAGGVSAQIWA